MDHVTKHNAYAITMYITKTKNKYFFISIKSQTISQNGLSECEFSTTACFFALK